MGLRSSLAHAFNAFVDRDTSVSVTPSFTFGPSTSSRPDRPRLRIHSERTIISSIYTRMAIDVAGVKIEHCRTNENGLYLEPIKSGLNECLNIEANIDQGGRHFRQDIAMTLFTEGVIAIIPVDTTGSPLYSGTWDIKTMRVGTILDWMPLHVKVRAWNEKKAKYQDIVLPKSMVAIVENPFYAVMNEPNSTLQRLVHKLSLLDNVDEISSQGKLDIIIQLPYVVKSESRKAQAQARAKEVQDQLQGSTYGIAYTDGTEKITQLNRSVENNLLEQVRYLKTELYNELGITEGIMNGTAEGAEMINYRNRFVEPIMDAITEAMLRTFLTKAARTQYQTLLYFETPFKMLTMSELADVVDVFSRNQIISPNEVRPAIGLKPSKEPQASQLINSNMPIDKQVTSEQAPVDDGVVPEDVSTDPEVDPEEADIDRRMAKLGIK